MGQDDGATRRWCAAAASLAGREPAAQVAHRPVLDVGLVHAEGVLGEAAVAKALNRRGMPTPQDTDTWFHLTVPRVLARTIPPA
ncbi:hypothetical protein [Falsiroseomonas sp. E2-1-a20]|uniref:hypothetical protein n=1 Tax=Falsiroseomonas sp. E2-1-a20 TaxID=3239300 RepID=UPI003F3F924E